MLEQVKNVMPCWVASAGFPLLIALNHKDLQPSKGLETKWTVLQLIIRAAHVFQYFKPFQSILLLEQAVLDPGHSDRPGQSGLRGG